MASYTTDEPKEGGGAFAVPEGEYLIKVIDADEGISQAGNEMIKPVFRVIFEDGTEGPKVYENLVFSEKTKWRVDQFVAACGKHPGKGVQFDLFPSMIFGWTCRAKLKIETYNGKDRNKVESFIIADVQAPDAVVPRPSAQAKTVQANAGAATADDEDQVPF
jgi:hypothetical protein